MSSNPPDWGGLLRVFGKIGLLSFGGPAAQIALMHKELVYERNWLSGQQYLNALGFCMLLPGPEAMQLATYAGWRLRGTAGGLLAGLLFVLPGAAVILALGLVYAYFGSVPLVSALFLGVKAAVLIVVIEALLRVSKKALISRAYWGIAALAFIAIFIFQVPYPLIVIGAGLYGCLFLPTLTASQTPPENRVRIRGQAVPDGLKHTAVTLLIWLAVWILPLLVADALFDLGILRDIALFFSRLAVVTFGGAYAVLAYMGQEAVSGFGWLTPGEMMDGLGLAETTPGPLILVTEFVAFLAAFRQGGLMTGIAGALVALWVTFVPCFLWIFVGAPYIDRICAQPRLAGALQAITAAVVGVILNLSIWFAMHLLFSKVGQWDLGWLKLWQPDVSGLDLRVLALSGLCAVMMFVLHWGIGRVLLIAAALGPVLSGPVLSG